MVCDVSKRQGEALVRENSVDIIPWSKRNFYDGSKYVLFC